jgi:hypothetical protein
MASKRWTWVTAAALLFAGLTNAHAHVHYCFDGRAPPATVHYVDAHEHAHDFPAGADRHDADEDGGHHDEQAADHDDLDLDVPNDALAKSLKHDLPAIVAAPLWAAGIEREAGVCLAAWSDVPPAPDPPYSRPPLRAPPR